MGGRSKSSGGNYGNMQGSFRPFRPRGNNGGGGYGGGQQPIQQQMQQAYSNPIVARVAYAV